MSKYPVSARKEEELRQWMEQLEIREEDLEEQFIRGSGKGGQKVNKTSSCVWVKHTPTGTETKCQEHRSRSMNRFMARREICRKIENARLGKQSKDAQERDKIRRQKRKRSKRAKEKILADKKARSQKKSLRGKIKLSSDDK